MVGREEKERRKGGEVVGWRGGHGLGKGKEG